MWLLINHTKPTNTLYLNLYLLTAGNYKPASRQLQNNSVKGAVVITMKRVIMEGTLNFKEMIELAH